MHYFVNGWESMFNLFSCCSWPGNRSAHARTPRATPTSVRSKARKDYGQAGRHTAHGTQLFFLELTAHHIALPVADLPPLTSSARLFCLAAVVHVKQHPCFLFEKNHHSLLIDDSRNCDTNTFRQGVTATIPFYLTHDKPNL